MRSLFTWLNRRNNAGRRPGISRWRQAKPEPACRIPLGDPSPSKATKVDCDLSLPAAVASSLLYPVMVPDAATSVILTEGTDAPPRATSTFSSDRARSSPPDGPSQEPHPSLVDNLHERLRQVLAPPFDNLLPGPSSILAWPGELMPFQLDGVRTLIGNERLLLADDMGLGKTLQVIAALRVLFVRHAIESALLVAPASILDQWRQELLKWAPELKAIIIRGTQMDRGWQWNAEVHVTIVSYETLRSDTGGPQSPPHKKTWGVFVADEAQRIKNRNTTSDAVKGIKRHRSWALTGTPLENAEDELASIVEFVDQGDLSSDKHYLPGLTLRARHQELQLRRKKAEVLQDLPPKSTTKLPISLLPAQQNSYDRAEKEGIIHLRELGRDVRIQHVLELIARLKQICNADPETGQSSKIEDIRQRVETLTQQGNRAIVFSQYTSAGFGVAAIAEALQDFSPLSFTGELSLEERRSVIGRFRTNDSHKALILSLRAGGVGLNLQEASYVFHLDRWWNPAIERQAEDRSHRYGQTIPVHVFKYSCIATIEERIDRILERKQELFDELVDDVSLDLARALSAEDLFGLFQLDRPRTSGAGV